MPAINGLRLAAYIDLTAESETFTDLDHFGGNVFNGTSGVILPMLPYAELYSRQIDPTTGNVAPDIIGETYDDLSDAISDLQTSANGVATGIIYYDTDSQLPGHVHAFFFVCD